MTSVDDQAEGIVLERQELVETVHFAQLTAAFYRALVEKRIGRAVAIHLTQHWMDGQACCPDDTSE